MTKYLSSKKYPDFVKFQLPVLIWMVIIFALSSIPGSTLAPIEFPYAHLIAHTLLYGMLYYLCYRAMRYQHYSKFVSGFSVGIALLLVALYGASDEYHQSFVPGRTEELKDLLIDLAAALVVLVAVMLIDKFRSGKNPPEADRRASIDNF